MLTYDELTTPERAVWDAFPEGRRVDLRTGVPERDGVDGGAGWGPERTVRAAVLVALLLGAHRAEPGAVAHRVSWIRSAPGCPPQTYEQLASWYRASGHDDDVRRVLLAEQRH